MLPRPYLLPTVTETCCATFFLQISFQCVETKAATASSSRCIRPQCIKSAKSSLGSVYRKTEPISDILNTDTDTNTDVGIYNTAKYRILTIKYQTSVHRHFMKQLFHGAKLVRHPWPSLFYVTCVQYIRPVVSFVNCVLSIVFNKQKLYCIVDNNWSFYMHFRPIQCNSLCLTQYCVGLPVPVFILCVNFPNFISCFLTQYNILLYYYSWNYHLAFKNGLGKLRKTKMGFFMDLSAKP